MRHFKEGSDSGVVGSDGKKAELKEIITLGGAFPTRNITRRTGKVTNQTCEKAIVAESKQQRHEKWKRKRSRKKKKSMKKN